MTKGEQIQLGFEIFNQYSIEEIQTADNQIYVLVKNNLTEKDQSSLNKTRWFVENGFWTIYTN